VVGNVNLERTRVLSPFGHQKRGVDNRPPFSYLPSIIFNGPNNLPFGCSKKGLAATQFRSVLPPPIIPIG